MTEGSLHGALKGSPRPLPRPDSQNTYPPHRGARAIDEPNVRNGASRLVSLQQVDTRVTFGAGERQHAGTDAASAKGEQFEVYGVSGGGEL
jgi:hypothetical protein